MATKFHWGHGIVVVLAIFIVFILSFVYKTLAKPEYDHKLVSEEYYNDEMYYQQEVDRLKNASDLKDSIKIQKTEQGIEIVFPELFDPKKIKGTYELQRTNDSTLDINGEFDLQTSNKLIPDEQLKSGRYNIKLLWTYDNVPFQINKKITY